MAHMGVGDKVIVLASKVRDELKHLNVICAQFPEVVAKEKEYLFAWKITLIQETQQEKESLANKIDVINLNLMRLIDELFELSSSCCAFDQKLAKNLSSLISIFQKMKSALNLEARSLKILEHLIEEINLLQSNFFIFLHEVAPQLEAHNLLIQKQLRYARENFAFWKKIEEDFASPYAPKTASTQDNAVSILNIRA